MNNERSFKMFKYHILSLFMCLSILSSFYSCTDPNNSDLYEGKLCINCGTQATCSTVGTKAMCAHINPNYSEANYKEGSTSSTCTVYFCDSCLSAINSNSRTGID